jgi:hypothetical protein
MTAVHASLASDRWSILETGALPGATSGAQLLAANGRFQSLARFALRGDGTIQARTEVPPVPESASLLDFARAEMANRFAPNQETPPGPLRARDRRRVRFRLSTHQWRLQD